MIFVNVTTGNVFLEHTKFEAFDRYSNTDTVYIDNRNAK